MGEETKQVAGQRKECCQQEENLLPYNEPTAPPDCEVMKCQVCGCRHFETNMEPGKLGVHGASMGGN